ncbi:MAG: hypothetical protein ACTHK7_01525 [Aureliella sp.]
MSEPPLMPAMVCRRCGATNPPHAVKCWLCEKRDHSDPYAVSTLAPLPSGPGAKAELSRVQLVFLGVLIACAAVALLIGVGIGVQDPGMLVPYAVVVGPAFLATGVRAAVMIGRKEQPRPSSLFFTFLWTSLFMAMALILLVVASVIAFFLWCVHMLTGGVSVITSWSALLGLVDELSVGCWNTRAIALALDVVATPW